MCHAAATTARYTGCCMAVWRGGRFGDALRSGAMLGRGLAPSLAPAIAPLLRRWCVLGPTAASCGVGDAALLGVLLRPEAGCVGPMLLGGVPGASWHMAQSLPSFGLSFWCSSFLWKGPPCRSHTRRARRATLHRWPLHVQVREWLLLKPLLLAKLAWRGEAGVGAGMISTEVFAAGGAGVTASAAAAPSVLGGPCAESSPRTHLRERDC